MALASTVVTVWELRYVLSVKNLPSRSYSYAILFVQRLLAWLTDRFTVR